jgi:hypothetical protein
VSPYKVIDMREIAKAFDLSVEQVEQEIAHLIVTKQIQAKIDSHSKVLTRIISNFDDVVALFSQGQRDAEQLQGGCFIGHQVHSRD